MSRLRCVRLVWTCCLGLLWTEGAVRAEQPGPPKTDLQVFLLGRSVGHEVSTVRVSPSGERELSTALEFTDRGGAVALSSTLRVSADGTPLGFQAKGNTYRFVNVDVNLNQIPRGSFPGRGYAPLAGRAWLVRYWENHGRPRVIPVATGGPAASVRIEYRGEDVIQGADRPERLRRFCVDGMVWGREAVWLDGQGNLAAIVTRVHILPLTAVRAGLAAQLDRFRDAAVRDRMQDLDAFNHAVTPLASDDFAVRGARIIANDSAEAIERGMVLVRAGRIAALGPEGTIEIPRGVKVIDARGATLMPGLIDMHAHASQIEWAPAYLASGVTTIRDMGGEASFLTAFKTALDGKRGIGPRMRLAGLVDGPGAEGFASMVVASEAEAREAVDRYAKDGFTQMKVYSLISLDLLKAIVGRAHEIGLTVTGHIPRGLSVEDAVNAGMDHVAHLPITGEPTSETMRGRIAFLAAHKTVVDPTLAWNELLSRGPQTAAVSFEPGMTRVSTPLAMNYDSVRNEGAGGRSMMQLRALKAMHDAGVPIVAGTDGAVPGFSLIRELELYVAAGLTPREALGSATRVSASALGIEGETGTLSAGGRADFVIVDGDPTVNISALRRRRLVSANGRLFDCNALERLAFQVGTAAPR